MDAKVPHRKRSLELLTTLFCFVWGAWVGNPFINTFGSAKIFDIMASLAPEWVWGTVFFVVGLSGLLIINAGDFIKARILINTAIMFLFVTLSILMGVSNIANTASPIYAIIALCSFMSTTELFYDWKQENIKRHTLSL